MSMSETIYPTYCRRLREVKALQVKRDNVEQLQSFVLGGQLIEMDPEWIFMFGGFCWDRQVAIESNWIVTEDGVNFEVMTDEQFRRDYEPK